VSDGQPKREILPIPDVTPVGLTTYDAQDPDTKYLPITPLRPAVHLLGGRDDRGALRGGDTGVRGHAAAAPNRSRQLGLARPWLGHARPPRRPGARHERGDVAAVGR
jgi:hypothetical protein